MSTAATAVHSKDDSVDCGWQTNTLMHQARVSDFSYFSALEGWRLEQSWLLQAEHIKWSLKALQNSLKSFQTLF